jgi:hypothetical protein
MTASAPQQPRLHGCTPYAVQLCNSQANRATDDATAVQLQGTSPGETGPSRATVHATAMQPAGCTTRAAVQPAAAAVAHQLDLDPRVTCTTCRHYWRTSRCLNHRQALLSSSEIGPDLAALPQHCPGFASLARPPPPPAAAHHDQTDHQTDRDRALTENPQTEPHQPPEPITEDNTMIVSEGASGASFTPCPPGSYLARCTRLVDLGTQSSDYQGETKTGRKLLLTFTVLDAETRREDGGPYHLAKRFSASLHEKSALRKDLASWRGRDFTPEELKGFNLRDVLGKSAFISVIHTAKGDRTFANLAGLMKPPRGMADRFPLDEPLLYWSMSDPQPDWAAFETLHAKVQEQIQASPEFARLRRPTSAPLNPTATAAPARPAAATEPPPHAFADLADDIDF